MKRFLLFLALSLIFQISQAAEKICFSSEVGFKMKEIKGWSNSLNIPNYCGLQVIKGSNLDTSAAILYPRLNKLTSRENPKDFIAQDLKSITEASQKVKLKVLSNYKTKNGLDFEVKELRGQDSPKGYEIFAYNLHKSTLLNIVFSTDKEEVFKKYKSDFYNFLDQITVVSESEIKQLDPAQYKSELENELKRENKK